MKIGVDASNIVSGGGLTHLLAFLSHARSSGAYSKIVVWSSANTLEKLPSFDTVEYRTNFWLNGSLARRIFWTTFCLHQEMSGLDVLFVPGGLYLGRFRPFVTMCRNMLPFTKSEVKRYGWSFAGLRLRLLLIAQQYTFLKASGVIFLSQYARREVERCMRRSIDNHVVISHGVSPNFRVKPVRGKVSPATRFLYVSTLAPYKNQRQLVQTFSALRQAGFEVELDLVGDGPEVEKYGLLDLISNCRARDYIRYLGCVAHNELPSLYAACDAVIYASGCENFPNILVESMASGKPILSSDWGPMPEILKDSAILFNPTSTSSIESAVQRFMNLTSEDRYGMAVRSYRLSEDFDWDKTFSETRSFIKACAKH